MANHFAPQTESTELAFEASSTRDTGLATSTCHFNCNMCQLGLRTSKRVGSCGFGSHTAFRGGQKESGIQRIPTTTINITIIDAHLVDSDAC